MYWPPSKAWTSKPQIFGINHFVAINYGLESSRRWILMTAVLDGSVSIKVSWFDLQDPTKWIEGWKNIDCLNQPLAIQKNCYDYFCHFNNASQDSGLTIPISKKDIRPWFAKH